MNSCVNLNIKNMRKVKEKQKKDVSQQNKTKQLKTIKNKSIQREERRQVETRGEERRQEGNPSTSLCVFVLIPHLYTCFIFICIYYSLGFTTLCLTSINFSIVI